MLHFSNKTIKMTKQNNFPTLNNNSKTPSFFRLTLVGLIGNVMEWYDFAVYGYFAVIIGQLYFPSKNPTISLIASFGAFAAGFLARPLGGIIFGRIGDLVGRQRAMLLSVITMAVPTVMMGLLPTYESIGYPGTDIIGTAKADSGTFCRRRIYQLPNFYGRECSAESKGI